MNRPMAGTRRHPPRRGLFETGHRPPTWRPGRPTVAPSVRTSPLTMLVASKLSRAAGHEDRFEPGALEDRLTVDTTSVSAVATDVAVPRGTKTASAVLAGGTYVPVECHQDPAD